MPSLSHAKTQADLIIPSSSSSSGCLDCRRVSTSTAEPRRAPLMPPSLSLLCFFGAAEHHHYVVERCWPPKVAPPPSTENPNNLCCQPQQKLVPMPAMSLVDARSRPRSWQARPINFPARMATRTSSIDSTEQSTRPMPDKQAIRLNMQVKVKNMDFLIFME